MLLTSKLSLQGEEIDGKVFERRSRNKCLAIENVYMVNVILRVSCIIE